MSHIFARGTDLDRAIIDNSFIKRSMTVEFSKISGLPACLAMCSRRYRLMYRDAVAGVQ
jgi:hypothetical protein